MCSSNLKSRLLYLILVMVFVISSVDVSFVDVRAEGFDSEEITDSLSDDELNGDISDEGDSLLEGELGEDDLDDDMLRIGEERGMSFLYHHLAMYSGSSEKVIDGDLSDIGSVVCTGNIRLSSNGVVTAGSIGTGTLKYNGDTLDIDIVSPSSPKTSLKTYIGYAKLSWSGINNVTGYEVWRKSSSSSSYSLYKTLSSTSINVPVYTTKYYYKVRSYLKNSDGVSYGNFSSAVGVIKPTISLSTNIITIDGVKYYKVTYNALQLKWNTIPGAVKYIVYKYSSSKKKYLFYKTVGSSVSSLSVTGLSPSTKYSFKIRAYDANGNYITSNAYARSTRGKTDGYFYNRVVWNKIWNGVLISSSRASDSTMAKYEANGIKRCVKYNYCTGNNTLYIHVYAKMVGAGLNDKYEYYNSNRVKTGTSSLTYKEVILSAMKSYWSRNVTGCSYDFVSGCNFKTSVIVHTSSSYSDQKRLTINCGNSKCKYAAYKMYWFTASCGISYGKDSGYYIVDYDSSAEMNIPTQKQLKSNGSSTYKPETSLTNYKKGVAHEFGHCLGLADAYPLGSKARITKNSEVGYYSNGVFKNIMYSPSDANVVDNDIEMILKATGDSVNGKNYSFQAYKTHTNGDFKYKKSEVIRK